MRILLRLCLISELGIVLDEFKLIFLKKLKLDKIELEKGRLYRAIRLQNQIENRQITQFSSS
jgi:hypothetical protein